MKEFIQGQKRFFFNYLSGAIQYLRARYILPMFADVLIISHPKAGRTWIRVILHEIFKIQTGQHEYMFRNLWTSSYEFFEMSRQNNQIPKILFTHLRSDGLCWLKSRDRIRSIDNKKVVLLVRDPRDIMVSYYFQLTRRAKSHVVSGMSLPQFLRSDYLHNLINFMNAMERSRHSHRNTLLIKYEDLHRDTIGEVDRLIRFMDFQVTNEVLEKAVAFGTFENMHEMERRGLYAKKRRGEVAHVLETWDVHDRDAYKVRKGKVGGYVDYLGDDDIHYLNSEIQKRLDPSFGYG